MLELAIIDLWIPQRISSSSKNAMNFQHDAPKTFIHKIYIKNSRLQFIAVYTQLLHSLVIWCHFIRVNLRRVTAASYLPEFKIGSQQNVNAQEGAEVAGEAVEMAELRRGKLMVVIRYSFHKISLSFRRFIIKLKLIYFCYFSCIH